MRLFTDTPHFYNSWRNMHCLACSAKGWESYVRIHTSYTRLWQECVHHLRPYTHVCGKSVCITYHAFSLIAASCDNLEICRIITATLEIYKCENMKLHVNTRCGTLQADVVEGLEVTYGKREDFTMLIWVSKHPLSPFVTTCLFLLFGTSVVVSTSAVLWQLQSVALRSSGRSGLSPFASDAAV